MYLGDDNFGNLEAFSKSVIGHELDHFAQNRLFGRLANPYGYDGGANYPVCSCAHVTSLTKRTACSPSRIRPPRKWRATRTIGQTVVDATGAVFWYWWDTRRAMQAGVSRAALR